MKVLYITLLLVGFLTSISYADNASTNEAGLILNELKEIRSALNRIADELSEIRSENEKRKAVQRLSVNTPQFTRLGPDIEKLADITLPDDASPDEVEKYILAIIAASQGQNSFSSRDPQVAMLTNVGKKNLPLLIKALPYSRSTTSIHIEGAIVNLADENSKPLILDSLPIYPNLVKAVVQNGWVADARDILLAELKNPGQYLPMEWISAVASLNDMESYPLLRKYFINSRNRSMTYKTIQYLPIENMPEAVAEAWSRSMYEPGYSRISMAAIAVKYGHLDALEALIESLTSQTPDNYYIAQEARPAIFQHTEFRGSNAELIEWFQANRSFLRFDPEEKKFKIDKEVEP
ncbi:hypothetical protein ACFL6W_03805 [Thermodesulfobacteriota bacterium]